MLYKEFVLSSPSAGSLLVVFLKEHAGACAARGNPLRIIVTEEEHLRTSAMNRRYWGFILQQVSENALIDGRQFDKDSWHEYFARKFGVCEEVTLPYGEFLLRRKSTTQMTVAEFSEYMTRIESYAADELGIELK